MLSRSTVFPSAILLAALLVSACDDSSPSARSPIASPNAPSPAASPAPPLPHLVGEWNLTFRLTEVKGSGCVAETLQSQIGVPNRYSLSIIQKGDTVDATLTSASGDFACTFPSALADSDGFTTVGRNGIFLCAREPFQGVRCGDGTLHNLFSWGQDISGDVSGTEMSGAWDAVFDDLQSDSDMSMKAQFTGSR